MTTYFVMSASSGSCYTIGQLIGSGSPRIFSGDAIYVYQMSSALWTTRDFGTTWINIIPNGLGYVSTICQTSGGAIVGGISSNVTYVTGSGATTQSARYQNYPEITAWSSGSPVPSGSLSDSVASITGEIPILVGNISVNNAARVWRAGYSAPYPMVKSDAGFPVTARVTDLDICE